jgi:hypothetical protein
MRIVLHVTLHIKENPMTHEDLSHEHSNEHGVVHHIVINGEQREVRQKRLSFQEICVIAFPGGPFGGNIRYTVTYGLPDGREGSMVQGDTINVEEGMVFYVGNTDRS